ncbi:hypothetical protein [Actinoplanes philippinensis]|uniref:hypothetical protein n=1 Tax=Actinoplanes philippinensis TaxID=35752 RepID=UPI0033F01E71
MVPGVGAGGVAGVGLAAGLGRAGASLADEGRSGAGGDRNGVGGDRHGPGGGRNGAGEARTGTGDGRNGTVPRRSDRDDDRDEQSRPDYAALLRADSAVWGGDGGPRPVGDDHVPLVRPDDEPDDMSGWDDVSDSDWLIGDKPSDDGTER